MLFKSGKKDKGNNQISGAQTNVVVKESDSSASDQIQIEKVSEYN